MSWNLNPQWLKLRWCRLLLPFSLSLSLPLSKKEDPIWPCEAKPINICFTENESDWGFIQSFIKTDCLPLLELDGIEKRALTLIHRRERNLIISLSVSLSLSMSLSLPSSFLLQSVLLKRSLSVPQFFLLFLSFAQSLFTCLCPLWASFILVLFFSWNWVFPHPLSYLDPQFFLSQFLLGFLALFPSLYSRPATTSHTPSHKLLLERKFSLHFFFLQKETQHLVKKKKYKQTGNIKYHLNSGCHRLIVLNQIKC